jgi:hypothetical protein
MFLFLDPSQQVAGVDAPVVTLKLQMKTFFLGMLVGEASTLLFNFVIWPAIKPMLFNSFIGLELKPLLDLFS